MNQMTFTISLQEVLLFILIVMAMVAVFFLIQVLQNLSNITKQLNEVVKKNNEELDATIKSLPALTEKADHTITKVNSILDDSSDAIVASIEGAKSTLENAQRMTMTRRIPSSMWPRQRLIRQILFRPMSTKALLR